MLSARRLAQGDPGLLAAIERSQRLLHRRALVAGAASALPVPGLDWAVDAALLSRLIPAINHHFGLTPQQIDRLDPRERDKLYIPGPETDANGVGSPNTRTVPSSNVSNARMQLIAVVLPEPFGPSKPKISP